MDSEYFLDSNPDSGGNVTCLPDSFRNVSGRPDIRLSGILPNSFRIASGMNPDSDIPESGFESGSPTKRHRPSGFVPDSFRNVSGSSNFRR